MNNIKIQLSHDLQGEACDKSEVDAQFNSGKFQVYGEDDYKL